MWLISIYPIIPTYLSLLIVIKVEAAIFIIAFKCFFFVVSCVFWFVYAAKSVQTKYLGVLSACFMTFDGMTTYSKSFTSDMCHNTNLTKIIY